MEEDKAIPSPASKAFINHLAKYAYSSNSNSTSPSKLAGPSRSVSPSKAKVPVVEIPASPRKRRSLPLAPVRQKGRRSIERKDESDSEYEEPAITPIKKKRGRDSDEIGTVEVKGKGKGKKPRGYAPPELYEHLRPVNDLLRDDLDRKKSSTMGHHFSHPTNKFWRSLHQSGLTPRLLDPTEDHLMPEYGYGLTNLVDRPTSEQSELSTLEMRLNVYNLTAKFLKYKPKIVCFVGKKIWDVYESVIKKTAIRSIGQKMTSEKGLGTRAQVKVEEEDLISSDINKITSSRRVKLESTDDPDQDSSLSPAPEPEATVKVEEPGSERLVKIETDELNHSVHSASTSGKFSKRRMSKIIVEAFDATKPRIFRLPHHSIGNEDEVEGYTYFWVVPNTSGLERTQLPEQIINFTALKTFLGRIQSQAELQEGEWIDIDPAGVEYTVEEMKRIALSKKA
ncbi:uncharacterized protein L199_001994 [Kwoniella botswanensis]|uniref:uncharacterized protein n=1 Tax=Kwoniella botswanensis TaxID=1268659 RepID=UPI00315D06B2